MPKKEETFYDKVYEVTKKIPEGRVTSYGAIANFLSRRGAARMVGYAMSNSPADVPAHRVVNRNGLLTGKHHFRPPGLMQQLLENEGVEVENDKVKKFKEVFWEPK